MTTKSKSVWICELDTRHFSFRYVAESEKEAEAAVVFLWEKYFEEMGGEEQGIDRDYVKPDDWQISELKLGTLYRDYDIIWKRNQ